MSTYFLMNQAITDVVSIDAPDIAPAKLQAGEINAFVHALVSGVVHQPGSFLDRIRFNLRGFITSFILRSESADKVTRAAKIGSRIHPLRSYAERVAQKEAQLRDTIAHGWIMVARVDGKAAALVGMHVSMTLPDNRKMYETTSITLSAYQHQGLNSTLRESFIQYMESLDPHPVFVTRSKNPTVIARCRAESWHEMSYAEITQQFGIAMSPKEIRYMEQDGWLAYVFDPTIKGPLSSCLTEIHEERHHKHPVFSIRPAIAYASGTLGVLAVMVSMFTSASWYSARFGAKFSETFIQNYDTLSLLMGIGLILIAIVIGTKKKTSC